MRTTSRTSETIDGTVLLLATPDKGISKLSMAMNMKLTSVENILLNSHINCLEEKDIFFTTSTKSIEKLLLWGANIDLKRCMHIRVPVLVRCKLTITNKAGHLSNWMIQRNIIFH